MAIATWLPCNETHVRGDTCTALVFVMAMFFKAGERTRTITSRFAAKKRKCRSTDRPINRLRRKADPGKKEEFDENGEQID